MPQLTALQRSRQEEQAIVQRIVLIMADGTVEEMLPRGHADAEDLQSRTDNLYRSEWENGLIDTIVAYDDAGQKMGTMTASEFFGERLGF